MNWSLDLGMMSNYRILESTGQRPKLSESTEHSSKPSPQIPILQTSREPKVIPYRVTTGIRYGTIVLPQPRPDSCRAKQF
jgi:hypothetical protein